MAQSHETSAFLAKNLFLLAVLCPFSDSASAAEATLTVRATIINCGTAQERPLKCRADQRCCNLTDSPQINAQDDDRKEPDRKSERRDEE